MPVPPLVTVMAALAVKLPLEVVTVIVAEPAAMPVTTPEELTVATDVLLEVQLTVLFDALEGKTVAASVVVLPAATVAEVGERVTPVTGIVVLETVTVVVAV